MIKCPNCGSSAQVVCEWHDKSLYHEIKAEYSCGCGCTFEVTFEPAEPKILSKKEC